MEQHTAKDRANSRRREKRAAARKELEAQRRAYREANADKIEAEARAKAARSKANAKARVDRYRKAHPDKVKALSITYREANAEKFKAKRRARYLANRGQAIADEKARYQKARDQKAHNRALVEAALAEARDFGAVLGETPEDDAAWLAWVWLEFRARNLTRLCRDVLIQLPCYRGPDGIAWPSREALADRVGCDVTSVRRALRAGRGLGLLPGARP